MEFARLAAEAVAARGRFTVALSGGDTPGGLYVLLAGHAPSSAPRVAWEKTEIFFGDERAVAPDHPQSNYRMAVETLLRHVPVPEEQVHRMRGENPDPSRAAEEYEEILRDAFRLGAGERPRLDLVLLGMGADGHTASLFPGSPALDETERLATAVEIAPPGISRITLTLPVFNAAAAVIFLVSGTEKAEAVRAVLGSGPPGAQGSRQLPAARVRPVEGLPLWLLDRDAARLIA